MQIGLRRYSPAFVENLADALVRKLRILGEAVGRNAHGNKRILTEEFAGMHIDMVFLQKARIWRASARMEFFRWGFVICSRVWRVIRSTGTPRISAMSSCMPKKRSPIGCSKVAIR